MRPDPWPFDHSQDGSAALRERLRPRSAFSSSGARPMRSSAFFSPLARSSRAFKVFFFLTIFPFLPRPLCFCSSESRGEPKARLQGSSRRRPIRFWSQVLFLLARLRGTSDDQLLGWRGAPLPLRCRQPPRSPHSWLGPRPPLPFPLSEVAEDRATASRIVGSPLRPLMDA